MGVASGSSTAAAGSSGASAPATAFASNVHSLLRGGALLARSVSPKCRVPAARRLPRWPFATGGLVNWPTAADPYWAADFPIRVQWCHGAPGIVASLVPLAQADEAVSLLGAAGELTWRAGPLPKGAGLCHGTAGNGAAFLALDARTGEERWLARARAFAMHALEQVEGPERTPLAVDRRHRGCALPPGMRRRLEGMPQLTWRRRRLQTGSRRGLGAELVGARAESQLGSARACPLARSGAKLLHRALNVPLSS